MNVFTWIWGIVVVLQAAMCATSRELFPVTAHATAAVLAVVIAVRFALLERAKRTEIDPEVWAELNYPPND